MRSRLTPLALSFLCLLIPLSLIFSAGPTVPSQDTAVEANGSPTYEQQVLEIVNQERWSNGQRPPLKGVDLLDNAAETHSSNMAMRNFFAHCDFDTHSQPGDRMQDAGYNPNSWGENIAAGYGTPAQVMGGWMGSTGHRNNILSTSFREIGIGYYYQANDQDNIRTNEDGSCNASSNDDGPFHRYWTQNFGRRDNVMPVVINREAYETTTREVDLYMYGDGWAESMRFRNEGGSWSSWQAYAENTTWTLSSGNGQKTVEAEISSGANGSGTVRTASDTIMLNEEFTGPELSASPHALSFVGNSADNPTIMTTTLTISNVGDELLTWSLSEGPDVAWLAASPTNGSLNAGAATAVNVTVDFTGLSLGVYDTDLIIDAGSAANSPQTVSVQLLFTDQPPLYLPAILK